MLKQIKPLLLYLFWSRMMLTPSLSLAWEQKEFFIGFWSPPPPQETTYARYKEIAEAGFNLVLGGNGVASREINQKALELCQQLNLKMLVLDDRIYGGQTQNLEEVLQDYSSFPSFMGFLVKDEPNTGDLTQLAQFVNALKKKNPRLLAYINLFPTYATPQQMGAEDYPQYLQRFLQEVCPEVLCFDHYPLLVKRDRPDFYQNLEWAREKALSARIPLWVILQVEGIEGVYRSPIETELSWQVMSALAYGAKGILYFTYWTPPPGVERHFDGIIGQDGKARAHYEWVKEINAVLRAWGPYLVKAKSVEVFHIGEPLPLGTQRLRKDSLLKEVEGGPALIGLLEVGRNRLLLLVVNRSYKDFARLKLFFNSKKFGELTEISSAGQKGVPLLKGEEAGELTYSLVLAPGKARLYEVQLISESKGGLLE